MNWQRSKLVLGLVLIALVIVSCGGGGEAPTPIVLVVTASPTPAAVITVVVTAPPPEATSTVEAVQLPPETGIELQEATFAHGLTENMQPENPGADFSPDETVYLSLRLKGRPKEGVVTSRFYWHDSLVADASVDLAEVNSGVLFSVARTPTLAIP